ncbi:MAG: chemotaxis protein CheW [Pyrinomonadaceae bacterium]
MSQRKSVGPRPHSKDPAPEQGSLNGTTGTEADRTRNLQLFRAGPFNFAVFQDEIATIVDWRDPAPLPYAPRSILGVVSIQGRMLTVLDVAALLDHDGSSNTAPFQQIVALRGDEQLGMAVHAVNKKVEVPQNTQQSVEGLPLQVFKHEGSEINILNTKELFAAALQGRERRRRRF